MNTITGIQLDRPPAISPNDPAPVPLYDHLILKCQALYTNGSPVVLTGAKLYVTIKDALTDLDAAALFQKNSTDNASYFSIDSATLGLYTVEIPAGELATATLAADTNYYIDTKIITSTGAVFTHIYDTIRPFTNVSKSTS